MPTDKDELIGQETGKVLPAVPLTLEGVIARLMTLTAIVNALVKLHPELPPAIRQWLGVQLSPKTLRQHGLPSDHEDLCSQPAVAHLEPELSPQSGGFAPNLGPDHPINRSFSSPDGRSVGECIEEFHASRAEQ